MSRGRTRSKHEELARTQRTNIRWRAVPWIVPSVCLAAAVYFVAGKRTEFLLSATITISLAVAASIVISGGALKIWRDGQEKKRLRALVDDLQRDWEQVDKERQDAMARVNRLQGQLEEIRRERTTGD